MFDKGKGDDTGVRVVLEGETSLLEEGVCEGGEVARRSCADLVDQFAGRVGVPPRTSGPPGRV
jgi:hypothetical protein